MKFMKPIHLSMTGMYHSCAFVKKLFQYHPSCPISFCRLSDFSDNSTGLMLQSIRTNNLRPGYRHRDPLKFTLGMETVTFRRTRFHVGRFFTDEKLFARWIETPVTNKLKWKKHWLKLETWQNVFRNRPGKLFEHKLFPLALLLAWNKK